jgi:AcrR family transcriptional regulator
MGRWQPDARGRLVMAAVDLFAEQGYDATTVVQIAERAGVTKSTFFRYFPDKRDVLTAGQAMLSRQLAEGIAAAPPDATPLEAVASGLAAVSAEMTSFNRELGPKLGAVFAANAELRERDAAKSAGMASAMTDALRQRGVAGQVARLAAELGVLAFRLGFERWVASEGTTLVEHTDAVLDELRAASAVLG